MIISLDNVQLAYQNKIIVENLTIMLPTNKIIAFLGPNGCGKSTIIKAIARLLKPKAGYIALDGQDVWKINPKIYAQRVSLLPQQHVIPEGITVRELIAYGRSPYLNLWGTLNHQDEQLITQALQQTHIQSLANRLVSDLSGGQQQHAFIAMILAQNTNVILLDEPTTYLDFSKQAHLLTLMRRLQQQGKTIITVLHDINQACRYCDYLVVFRDGALIEQGEPSTVMTAELLDEVFDLDVLIHRDPVSGTPMFIAK